MKRLGGLGEYYCWCLCVMLVIVAVLAIYHPVLTYDVMWDEVRIRVGNDYYQRTDFMHEAFLENMGLGDFYRPLVALTFVLESYYAGIKDVGMVSHTINVVLLVIDGILVGILAALQAGQHKKLVFTVAALLFLLHPVLIASFGFVATRFDIMAILFMLAILLVEQVALSRWYKNIARFLLMLLAIFSKEYAVVILPTVALFSLQKYWGDRFDKASLRQLLTQRPVIDYFSIVAYLLPVFIYMGLRYYIHLPFPEIHSELAGSAKWMVFPRFLLVAGMFTHLFFLPQDFILPSYRPVYDAIWHDPHFYVGIVTVLAVLLALVFLANRTRLALVVLLMVLMPFLQFTRTFPVEGLFWPWYLDFSIALLAIWCVPAAILRLYGLWSSGQHRQVVLAIFMFAVWMTGSVVVINQLLVHWQNGRNFFLWWMEKNPGSSYAAENYVMSLVETTGLQYSYDETRKLVLRFPEDPELRLMAANLALKFNHYDDAEENMLKGIEYVTDKNLYRALLLVAVTIETSRNNLVVARQLLIQANGGQTHNVELCYALTAIRLYKAEGDEKQAKALFATIDKVLDKNPEISRAMLGYCMRDEQDLDAIRSLVNQGQ